ncbi:leucine-rich repeat-containing protein 15-like [Stylophora pistillata]|uniref:leucine-rich repeat-containing protein 15-like n=1 Tax=Stylophora pistillata TaxID=50429 RepID=UPI000C04C5F2|nr:leucine-rich repeat-containing protein 15-like [Stylophora pistillata]
MPEVFQQKYPITRVILDCTELFIEKPSCFRAQSDTYSTYESHNTAKGLVGIAPDGALPFVSDLYGGHCSDKIIVKHCGILQLLEEGDSVMADRGFEIQELLTPRKPTLINRCFYRLLQNNKIAFLPEGLFDNLVNLKWLRLQNNNITFLPEGLFDNLVNSKGLRLENNKITFLPEGLFDNLVNLEWLRVQNNSITFLPEGLFDNLVNLKRL